MKNSEKIAGILPEKISKIDLSYYVFRMKILTSLRHRRLTMLLMMHKRIVKKDLM